MAIKLSKRGYERLRQEFDRLSKEERPRVVQGVATAALEGDRSENAEYIYGKKRLREIDRRLRYLSHLLKNPQVVDRSMVSSDVVAFGSKVTVVDDAGQKKIWTIVGEGEADFKDRTISCQSLVARALLGKRVGEVAEVELEKGDTSFEVIKIEVGDVG